MAVYTVHEPPSKAGAPSVPERFVFVRDGFSFAALLFGPLWMLRHRLWLVLLLYGAMGVGLWLGLRLHASTQVGLIVWGLIGLLLGFEAGLRRFTLGRRGYRNIGIVVGDDLELAERRFFDAWIRKDSSVRKSSAGASAQRSEPAAPTGVPALPASLPAQHPILGLFPEPGAAP
jgi:hypothetical protein